MKSVGIISLMTGWLEGVLEGNKREKWKTSMRLMESSKGSVDDLGQ